MIEYLASQIQVGREDTKKCCQTSQTISNPTSNDPEFMNLLYPKLSIAEMTIFFCYVGSLHD